MSYSPVTGLAYIPALSVPGYYHQNGAYSYKEGFQNTGIEEGVTNFRALNPQVERQKIRFGTWLSAWNPATQSEAWRVELPDLGGGTLVTAGNLVWQGQGTGEFAAYRADNGDKLWSFQAGTTIMPGPSFTTPSTHFYPPKQACNQPKSMRRGSGDPLEACSVPLAMLAQCFPNRLAPGRNAT